VQAISQQTSLPVEQSKPMLDVFLRTARAALQSRRRIEFRGFGAFVVRDYEAAPRRNPRTGDVVLVGPRCKAVFKPSGLMLDRLNGVSPSSQDDSSSQ